MVSPPIVMGAAGVHGVPDSNVLSTHLRQYVFALLHQAYCSIVRVRSPVVGEPADWIAIGICVMRVQIHVVHECGQVWSEWRRANSYRFWEVLVLLLCLECAPHTSVRVRRARAAYTTREGDVSRSAAQVAAHSNLPATDEVLACVIKLVVHQIVNVYTATAAVASGIAGPTHAEGTTSGG